MKRWGLIVAALCIGCSLATVYLYTKPPGDSIVVFGEDSSNLKAYASSAAAFTAKTGDKALFEGATFEQSVQKADADFRSGSGHYDIVLQYNFSLSPYVTNSYVLGIREIQENGGNLQSIKEDEFFKNVVLETSYYYSNPKDRASSPAQFGYPFAGNTLLLVYNRNLFENPEIRKAYEKSNGKELNVPASWDEYISVAEFFKRLDRGLSGVAMQGASDGWLYYEAATYLFSMGTGTSRKEYGWQEGAPLSIATTENESVLKYMKRLRESSAGDFFTVGASQQQNIMLSGKTAMALMWSDYVEPLSNARNKANGRLIFGFAPIPGGKSGLAGGAFYVNKKSRQVANVAKFISYAMSSPVQSELLTKGLCSPMRTAYTEEIMARVPYAKALRDSLARGQFMFEAASDAETINTALTTNIQRYMRGEITESNALKSAQKQVEDARRVSSGK